MPPKQQTIRGGNLPASRRSKGFASETYSWITDSENRSVVTSVAFFAVCDNSRLEIKGVRRDSCGLLMVSTGRRSVFAQQLGGDFAAPVSSWRGIEGWNWKLTKWKRI